MSANASRLVDWRAPRSVAFVDEEYIDGKGPFASYNDRLFDGMSLKFDGDRVAAITRYEGGMARGPGSFELLHRHDVTEPVHRPGSAFSGGAEDEPYDPATFEEIRRGPRIDGRPYTGTILFPTGRTYGILASFRWRTLVEYARMSGESMTGYFCSALGTEGSSCRNAHECSTAYSWWDDGRLRDHSCRNSRLDYCQVGLGKDGVLTSLQASGTFTLDEEGARHELDRFGSLRSARQLLGCRSGEFFRIGGNGITSNTLTVLQTVLSRDRPSKISCRLDISASPEEIACFLSSSASDKVTLTPSAPSEERPIRDEVAVRLKRLRPDLVIESWNY